MQRKTNKAKRLSIHLGTAPNEICGAEIPGHISFKHIDLKW